MSNFFDQLLSEAQSILSTVQADADAAAPYVAKFPTANSIITAIASEAGVLLGEANGLALLREIMAFATKMGAKPLDFGDVTDPGYQNRIDREEQN